jgi:hypothetical protein
MLIATGVRGCPGGEQAGGALEPLSLVAGSLVCFLKLALKRSVRETWLYIPNTQKEYTFSQHFDCGRLSANGPSFCEQTVFFPLV